MESLRKTDREALVGATAISASTEVFSAGVLERVLIHGLGLTPQTPVCVAFSGGIDSHVLLHALSVLRADAQWRLRAIHVDHGLQPQSSLWAEHCNEVCRQLQVPCLIEHIHVRDIDQYGMEDAARRARYDCFARSLVPGEVLLLAHHQNDQAETVLLQLLRGAGVQGLAAMRPMVDFAAGRLARPLLGFHRGALTAYALKVGLRWIDDPSNQDTRHARNFLRASVLPEIFKRWPAALRSLTRVARHSAEAAALLDDLARLDEDRCREPDGALTISKLAGLSRARRSNLVRYWIRSRNIQLPSERVLQQILAQIEVTPDTQHAAVSWGAPSVRRYRDRLVLLPLQNPITADWRCHWDITQALSLPGGRALSARAVSGQGLSQARIAGKALEVRLRQGGERLRLPGGGHRRKLKKLLQEAGVPPWERNRLPLIYADNELVAVGDRWVAGVFAAGTGEAGWLVRLE